MVQIPVNTIDITLDVPCEWCNGDGRDSTFAGCYHCKGTGRVPTELGQEMLEFIKRHWRILQGD